MPRSKRAPALFELIQRQQAQGARSAPIPATGGRQEDQSVSATPPDQPPPPAPAASHTSPTVAGPPISFQDGRAHLSLSPVSCAVVLGTVLLLIAGSFSLGRRAGWRDVEHTSQTAAPDNLANARQSTPNASVFHSLLTRSAGQSTPPQVKPHPPAPTYSRNVPLQPGKTYLVIQTFKDSSDDAVRAQEFLAAKNVPTKVVQAGTTSVHLLSAESFDYGDSDDRDRFEQFRKSLRVLGRIYASKKYRGGYDFRDCYPYTFKRQG